jgi:hypothetical protein
VGVKGEKAGAAFRALPRKEQERLFLDILETPPFRHKGGWGRSFHTWLEEQSAESRPLGEIAARLDFPTYHGASVDDPWNFIGRHTVWLIENGYARVFLVEVVGETPA